MTRNEAMAWLHQVKGQLYRNERDHAKGEAWVAVVRVPRAGPRGGKLIIALGQSVQEAAAAAEGQWQTLWRDLSRVH